MTVQRKEVYQADVEQKMRNVYDSRSEKDRRAVCHDLLEFSARVLVADCVELLNEPKGSKYRVGRTWAFQTVGRWGTTTH